MKSDQPSIVCATDFSLRAGDAATVAAKLAQQRSEKLHLIHVTNAPRAGVRVILRERLEVEAQRLRSSGADVEPILLDGLAPSKELLAYIRRVEPGLVVVGCGKKGALDRWALGSFSERIAEASPVPTLVVRNSSAFESWDWSQSRLIVLLALDFSSSSDAVLRWAKQFQRAGPCDLIACHVNWRVPTVDDTDVPGSPLVNSRERQQLLERDLRKKIRDHIDDGSLDVVVRPYFGDPGPCIADIATEKRVHLIAVGAHQRRGIHRLAQFSVSRDVLHNSALNVVCVPVTAKFDAREAHIPEFRRVLVATDFSELGNTAVPFGCAASAVGGLVKLVHVVSPNLAKRRGVTWSSDLRAQLRALIPDEAGARCQPPEVELLKERDVATAICSEAERFGADVVCMSSHGLGASRALHGSVTKAVLKRIRRPLLVIRRSEG